MDVLLIDGDARRRASVTAGLEAMGLTVTALEAAAPPRGDGCEKAELALVALDGGAADLVRALKSADPLLPVVVIADRTPDSATAAALGRARAHDVLVVRGASDLAACGPRLRQALLRRAARKRTPPVAELLRGSSDKIAQVRRYIERASRSEANVLVTGESGTGKELVARAIHDHSSRASGPFVALNCAAIPEPLLESELFGHERGAFTGAEKRVRGRLEQAHGGTILFDEIGEMPALLQAKLLRALQPPPGGAETARELTRVGAESAITVDVRVVSATHRDLTALVREGRFREDLLQRLNVVHVHAPALRERREDIPELARHFLARHAELEGLGELDFDPLVMEVLAAHDWPLNVRELEAVVRQLVVMKEGGSTVVLGDLPPHLFGGADPAPAGGAASSAFPPLSEVLRDHVHRALELARGNKSQAARLLGISRQALDRRLAGEPE